MDKHERPYRCEDPQCEKLQGFTYSGGLLRHEREVHQKHGGPKERLFCPHKTCKRNSDRGFTRKENLNEHVRRVHDKNSQAQVKPEDVAETSAVDGATPFSECSDFAGPSISIAIGKRKRDSVASLDDRSDTEKEELKSQIRKLTRDNRLWRDRYERSEKQVAELKHAQKRRQEGD